MANIKAYIIRLKGIESSENLANECIETGKKHGLEITPFDGIYGQRNIDQTHNIFKIHPWKEKLKKGRLGVQGCFLSHYSLWLKCIDENIPIMILEQDAYILRHIPNNIEDMFVEFLNLDPYDKNSKEYTTQHQKDEPLRINEYFNKKSRQKYGIIAQYVFGTHGYIIKPSAAKKLVIEVKENGYRPVDIQCHKGIINIETIYPSIVSLNPRYYGNIELIKKESSTQKTWN